MKAGLASGADRRGAASSVIRFNLPSTTFTPAPFRPRFFVCSDALERRKPALPCTLRYADLYDNAYADAFAQRQGSGRWRVGEVAVACRVWRCLASPRRPGLIRRIFPAAASCPRPNDHYRVEVGFLGTDIERMFAENKEALQATSTSPSPASSRACSANSSRAASPWRTRKARRARATVVSVGEDPANPYDSKAVLRIDCSGVPGPILYNPYKLLEAQGAARQTSRQHRREGRRIQAYRGAALGPRAGARPSDDLSRRRADRLSKPLLTPWQLAPKFFAAGVEHIMTGYDHICFLLAVVLWASRAWPVVKIVTAFTVSHSITLTLAALQIVNLPSAWTEVAIALSIIYVARREFLHAQGRRALARHFLLRLHPRLWLRERADRTGVPQRAIVPALASFNLGVEAGQIGVVLIVIPLLEFHRQAIQQGRAQPASRLCLLRRSSPASAPIGCSCAWAC